MRMLALVVLAALRWTTSEDHYLAKMREMFGAERSS